MPHVFTRAELYAMVWAEPIRTIASRLGVSDVGLAKACRRSDIPTPERGYWAKLQHGKPTRKPPLPKRNDLPDRVILAPWAPKPKPAPPVQAVLDAPAPPAVTVPSDLRSAHPAVTRWTADNAESRREYRNNSWGLSMLLDFKDPLQARRLRLYSALFKGLTAAGVKLVPGRNPEEWSEVHQRNEKIEFRIYLRRTQSRRPLTAEERKDRWLRERGSVFERSVAGDLILKINKWGGDGLPVEFRETKTPLEDQLGEAIVALKAWLAHDIEREKERQAERRRWEEDRAFRARQAAHAKSLEERQEKLLGEAKRWRRAADLRAMVNAAAGSPRAQMEGFGAWSAWALAEADAVDPLAGGRLNLTLIGPFDPEG